MEEPIIAMLMPLIAGIAIGSMIFLGIHHWDLLLGFRGQLLKLTSYALSASIPLAVLWLACLAVGSGWDDALFIYALSFLGCPLFVRILLLVVVIGVWSASLLTDKPGDFAATHIITWAAAAWPPSLLLLEVIPYVGP